MNEAERRAAWEAAVTEALHKIAVVVRHIPYTSNASPKRAMLVVEAVANVRTLHEAAVDAAPEDNFKPAFLHEAYCEASHDIRSKCICQDAAPEPQGAEEARIDA